MILVRWLNLGLMLFVAISAAATQQWGMAACAGSAVCGWISTLISASKQP